MKNMTSFGPVVESANKIGRPQIAVFEEESHVLADWGYFRRKWQTLAENRHSLPNPTTRCVKLWHG